MKMDKIKIGERPTTPAGFFWLKENGINLWDHPDLRLRIINKAEDLGRQLTKQELEEMGPDITYIIGEEESSQARAFSLEKGLHKDRVVGVEVLHEPNYGSYANIRIRAITEKGFKVIVRTLSGGLDFSKIPEKRKMAEDFAQSLIGHEIEFYKMVRDLPAVNEFGEVTGVRGQRVYLRVRAGTLPEFENLDYQKLKHWAGKKRK